jgi:predicted RNA-binding protein with PIN domain
MPYLIDGNNLIGHMPDLSLKNRIDRRRLLQRLLAFQTVKNTRIILVFDGPPDDDFAPERFQDIPFSVRFPTPEESADSVIKDIISLETDLRQFFVVSSDREIGRYAHAKGAKSIKCEAFLRELKAARKEYREGREMEKTERPPSPLEVKLWDDIFQRKK